MHLVPKRPINDIAKIAGGTLFGLIFSAGILMINQPSMLKVQLLEDTIEATTVETKSIEEKKFLWEAMMLETLERVELFLEEGRKFNYPLVQNKSGKQSFIIPQNTCRNGVRVKALARTEEQGDRFEANLQIIGIDRLISRTVLKTTLDFSSEKPLRVIHLPTSFAYQSDDGTVFPKYSILPGRNSDKVKYDVWCY